MLMMTEQSELQAFITANNNKDGIEWVVNGDRLHFRREKSEVNTIPSKKMINLTLNYATELNRII